MISGSLSLTLSQLPVAFWAPALTYKEDFSGGGIEISASYWTQKLLAPKVAFLAAGTTYTKVRHSTGVTTANSTNKYQNYQSVELGDQLIHMMIIIKHNICLISTLQAGNSISNMVISGNQVQLSVLSYVDHRKSKIIFLQSSCLDWAVCCSSRRVVPLERDVSGQSKPLISCSHVRSHKDINSF